MIIYAEGAVNNGRTIGNNESLFLKDHRGRRIGFSSTGSEGNGLAGSGGSWFFFAGGASL